MEEYDENADRMEVIAFEIPRRSFAWKSWTLPLEPCASEKLTCMPLSQKTLGKW
jgi:hypothetical protein